MLTTNSDSCPDVSVGAKLVVGVGEVGGAEEVAVGSAEVVVAVGVLSSTVSVGVKESGILSGEEEVVHATIINTNVVTILQHRQVMEP